MNAELLPILLATVRLKYKCEATYEETVAVNERMDERVVWEGNVEVFRLAGQGEAIHCYAWVNDIDPVRHEFVTILRKGFVISPEIAVKAWLGTRPVVIHPVIENDTALFKHSHASADGLL